MASIISRSPAETLALGAQRAQSLRAGDVLALTGDLGTGKTQFVKGLAEGLGIPGAVTSPTFTLVHEYGGGRLPLFHADLYRLDDPGEALHIGIDDYFEEPGVTVIEWAEKIVELIPARAQWIEFRSISETERELGL